MVTTRHPSGTRRVRRLATLATLCLVSFAAARGAHAATGTLEATVEPRVADEGEPVRLTLRFRGEQPGARPDLSPLESDFDVLGSQQSQQISIVNGDVEQTRELQILLAPKRSGEIEIPALHAGDLATEPVTLTVRDANATSASEARGTSGSPAAPDAPAPTGYGSAPATGNAAARAALAANDAPDLFVEATVDQASPFVQGEVGYTVRVYDGVGIREGALTEPTAPGVRIEARGDARTFEDVVGGRRYVVHERQYAAFPQASGDVTIPPVVLQARVPDQDARARRSPFDGMFGADDMVAEMFAQMRRNGFGGSILDRMMSPGREIRVRSNPITLSVRGRPASAADGWFLPATSVTLSESWSPAAPSFRVGETVERTVVLRAAGASAAQLPQIAAADVAGVKQYAAKPETRTVPGGAELVQRFDVLPTEAGTITLPRVEIPWWDTTTDTQRTAVLPEQTVEVLPATGTAAQQAASAPTQAGAGSLAAQDTRGSAAKTSAPATALDTANAPGDAATPRSAADDLRTLVSSHAASSAGVAATLLALVGCGAALARRRRGATAAATAGATRSASGSALAAPARVPARALVDGVHRACAGNDARAVRDALVAWARATWSDAPPTSAAAIARRTGDEAFARTVKSLDDSLYAPQTAPFDGAAFRRAFDAARRAGTHGDAATPEVLPALYPDSRLA